MEQILSPCPHLPGRDAGRRGNAGQLKAAGYSEAVASFPGDRAEKKRLYLERFA